jgi:hypothetical protein
MVSATTVCYSFSIMGELLVTLLLIGLALMWVVAWRYQRRFAIGTVVGAVVAALVAWIARPFELTQIPIWLPPLPFALVAITLFCFGALAWFWGED